VLIKLQEPQFRVNPFGSFRPYLRNDDHLCGQRQVDLSGGLCSLDLLYSAIFSS
jgi:hypothetical protein